MRLLTESLRVSSSFCEGHCGDVLVEESLPVISLEEPLGTPSGTAAGEEEVNEDGGAAALWRRRYPVGLLTDVPMTADLEESLPNNEDQSEGQIRENKKSTTTEHSPILSYTRE